MSEESDLRARVEALEAQIDSLVRAQPTDGSRPEPSARTAITRRGLLTVAAGAVAGGAAATLATATRDDGLDTHLGDASSAHKASAIAVTPKGELVETDVQAALGALEARLASLLQFSPDYLQDYAFIYDDLFGGSTTSGQIGTLGWQLEASNGGALAAAAFPAVAHMPGCYQLRTGSSTPNGRCALHLEEASLYGHPLFVWEARVATTQVNDGTQDAAWRVGLHDDLGGGEPNNGFYFEYTGANPTLHCRTAAAGVRTDVDSKIRPDRGNPYRLRIVSDGGGAAYFSVDDAPVATISSGLPAARGESFGPTMTIVKTVGTGTSHALTVDYVYLLWAVSR